LITLFFAVTLVTKLIET